MSERVRAWLEDLAHFFTIVSALVVVGVGTVFSVAFQALLAALFTLSLVERVLLGIGAFLVILSVIVVALKYVLRRRSSASKVASEAEPGREVQELRTKLHEREQRIDELQKLLAANRPPQHFKRPVETVDLRTPDEAKEIEAEKEKLNTEIEELKTQLEEAQQTIRSQRNAMEDEQGVVHWGEFQAREIGVSVDTAALKAENEQLKRQNEELTQRLDERKRERIEKWRSVICDFDFETERFAETDSYSQMKQCGLKPEVIDIFEAQRTDHVGNEARGDTAYKSTLLDEVARIENERVLNAPEVANDKESLRHRCILLGQELLQFMKVHGYADETVNRFVQRHEWKVNELRDELDERAWLTTQERDTLTFHADDYSHKIEEIANTLVLLGRGH